MFGGNGGQLGFTIGNPKYPRDFGGPNGSEPPRSYGWLTKTLFTSLGIFSCTFTSSIPLGFCGLNLILTNVWIDANTNGTLVIIVIDYRIAIKYNGTNLTSSILKLEVPP